MKALILVLIMSLYSSLLAKNDFERWWDESVTGREWKTRVSEVRKNTRKLNNLRLQRESRIKDIGLQMSEVTRETNRLMEGFKSYIKTFNSIMEEQKVKINFLKESIEKNQLGLLKMSSNLQDIESAVTISEEVLDSLSDTTNSLMILALENDSQRKKYIETIFQDESLDIKDLILKSEFLRESLSDQVYNKEFTSSKNIFKTLERVNNSTSDKLEKITQIISQAKSEIKEVLSELIRKWKDL